LHRRNVAQNTKNRETIKIKSSLLDNYLKRITTDTYNYYSAETGSKKISELLPLAETWCKFSGDGIGTLL